MKEAAERFGLSASHLRLLARTGRLGATKLGRDWFATPEAITTYLNNPELRKRGPRTRREH
jgi:excisionase family DNA binding protein